MDADTQWFNQLLQTLIVVVVVGACMIFACMWFWNQGHEKDCR